MIKVEIKSKLSIEVLKKEFSEKKTLQKMENLNCFSRVLVSEGDWEENLGECRILMGQQSSLEIWSVLGNDVESFRDRLAEWMESFSSQSPSPRAWLAAKTYCDLVRFPGSEAYRACDRKSMRTLVGLMKKAGSSEIIEEGEARKKKRKSFPSEEEREDWNLFFATLSRQSENLDMDELSEMFINFGLRLNSQEALLWIESVVVSHNNQKKRVSLLKTLLTETLQTFHTNELNKEKSIWISSALRSLTKSCEDSCLAFVQRLTDRVEFATQGNRTKLVDLVKSCLLNETVEVRDRFLRYCAEGLILGEKAIKRILACELLATLASSTSTSLHLANLAERTRDSIATVRCAALRSITLLASKKPFILLEDDECL